MSLYDFYKSREILDDNPTFAALIMAAAEKARTISHGKLQATFPRIIGEFYKRRLAPLNMLDGDEFQLTLELNGTISKFKKVYREKKHA